MIDYTYDYQNRLVEREMTGGTADHAYYVHQGDNIALELDGLQSGDLTHRYLWGAAVDQLLADDQRGGELLWTLGDHEQTIRSVIDNTGRIRIYRRYDSYGQITQEFKYDASGNIIPDTHAEAVDELFAYTGRQLDKDTGNQKHGQRWYDPPTGGWLSEDPSGFNAGDMNLYRYVGNNPVNYVDPSGLDWSGFSSFMPGFQDYGSTSQWQVSGSVPRVNPPSNGVSAFTKNYIVDVAHEVSRERLAESFAEVAGVSHLPRIMWPDNRAYSAKSEPLYDFSNWGQWDAGQDSGDRLQRQYLREIADAERMGNPELAEFLRDSISANTLPSRPALGYQSPRAREEGLGLFGVALDVGGAALEVGASMVPYVGEAMDFQVLVSPSSAWWERGLAGASLGVNVIFAGVLPNVGGFLRGGRRLAGETAETVVDAVAGVRRGVHNGPSSRFLQEGTGSGRLAPYHSRTANLPASTTLNDVMENAWIPGREGITLTDSTIRFADVYRLTEKTGIEFGLTRELVGGRQVRRLYSGGQNAVTLPTGPGIRSIGHTHPSAARLPSSPDINSINRRFMNALEADPLAPVPHSRVMWGSGATDSTIYYPNVLR